MDRDLFAAEVTRAIEAEPAIEIRREEVVTALDPDKIWIIASGPLTSDALAAEIGRVTGSERLFFYDSISPIVDAESIDLSIAFRGVALWEIAGWHGRLFELPLRQGRSTRRFSTPCSPREGVPAHIEADHPRYFEACLPIEEIARRGRDTLRFGPMKPMGLTDPRTGRRPYAVVQLRQENARAGSYNLVGFQNHMRFGEQQRVLRMIPGLRTPSSCASGRCTATPISTHPPF